MKGGGKVREKIGESGRQAFGGEMGGSSFVSKFPFSALDKGSDDKYKTISWRGRCRQN